MFRLHTGEYIAVVALVVALGAAGVLHAFSPLRTTYYSPVQETVQEEKPLYEGKYVVVNLNTMKVELRNGTTTLAVLDVISKGKPGSYYETIGGAYENDYKIRQHFSSIGHVYMPWSVHVFGNFFIHGIPYYENGNKVSSTYSGGCVRLSDDDAQQLYEFVEKGTPIVITEESERDFIPTATTTQTVDSMEMTRYMVAIISLDVLTQDNQITDTDGETLTTRRQILPRLILQGDDAVSKQYAKARGETTFVNYMNQKAKALGLTNTSFTSVDAPAITTRGEFARFMEYVRIYKSYLIDIATSSSTQPVSQ